MNSPYTKTPLELEFDSVVESVGTQIDEMVAQAAKLIAAAQALSDAHGVPFYSSVSPLGQAYVPDSFHSKFSDLVDEDGGGDGEPILNGLYSYQLMGEVYGWEHSDIC